MSKTIVKKACKCRKCKVVLNVGDVAIWYKKEFSTVGTHGHHAKGYVQWEMECADKEACKGRIHAEHLVKQAAQAAKAAQETINLLRSVNTSEENVQKMIDYYASKGIVAI